MSVVFYFDFSFSRFYLACDQCDDWFHGRCVGILPIEAETTIKTYICPRCDPAAPPNYINLKTLKPEDFVEISKTLKQIQGHKSAASFMEPVNSAEVPNYYKHIKEPMGKFKNSFKYNYLLTRLFQ